MATDELFNTALKQLEKAKPFCGIDPNIFEYMHHPQQELTVNFPVRMDDNTIRMFTGYRVQYNNARGPYKGGIRYHPNVSLDEIRALASWMTWKTALAVSPRFVGDTSSRPCLTSN